MSSSSQLRSRPGPGVGDLLVSIKEKVLGAVIKGPLENALVFLDYNNDGFLDANEPSVRTNVDGIFHKWSSDIVLRF